MIIFVKLISCALINKPERKCLFRMIIFKESVTLNSFIMKKLIFILALVGIFSTTFISCAPEKKENNEYQIDKDEITDDDI